jgi:hypothetical protein
MQSPAQFAVGIVHLVTPAVLNALLQRALDAVVRRVEALAMGGDISLHAGVGVDGQFAIFVDAGTEALVVLLRVLSFSVAFRAASSI